MSIALAATGASAWAQSVVLSGPAASVQATDVRAAAEQFPPEARAQVLSRKEAVALQAQQIYVRRALAQEAEKAGMDKDPLIAAQIQQAREKVLSDARLAALEKASPTDEKKIEAYALSVYKSDPKKFEGPARTRVRHILLRKDTPDAMQKAQGLLQQLKSGASFEELAKANSIDGSARRGGDLGFFGPGTMVKPFEEAANALKAPGELSGIVETQFGYHIIKLEERRSSGLVPFDEVREALVAQARDKFQTDARQAKAREILQDAKVNDAAVEALTRQAAGR